MVKQFTFVAPAGRVYLFFVLRFAAFVVLELPFYVNFYERAHQMKLIPKNIVDFVSLVTGLSVGLVAVGFSAGSKQRVLVSLVVGGLN